MEQHPVPQHIASFEFKLFGNLTVRQFVTLAIPLTIAALVFFSGIVSILRITLAVIIGGFGFFSALVPIQGRPFDKWFIAFIRAILMPTRRIWIKEEELPEFLSVVIRPAKDEEQVSEEITVQSRERMLAYLRSLPRGNQSPLDIKEQIAIQELNLTMEPVGEGKLPPPIIWPMDSQIKQKVEPKAEIIIGESKPISAGLPEVQITAKEIEEEANLLEQEVEKTRKIPKKIIKESVILPKISDSAKPYVLPGIEEKLREKVKKAESAKPATAHLAMEANFSVDNIFSFKGPNNQVRVMRGIGKTRVRKLHFAPPENFDLTKLPIRGEKRFEISDELAKRFHFEEESPDVVLPTKAKSVITSVQINIPPKGQVIARSLPKQAKETVSKKASTQAEAVVKPKQEAVKKDYSKFSLSNTKQSTDVSSLVLSAQIIPLTNIPNVISGLVADKGGLPIAGAVLVVRDANGIPVRALKTNKLGQFLSATPLANGVYTLEVESDQVKFKPTQLNLNGQVVQPLGIVGETLN